MARLSAAQNQKEGNRIEVKIPKEIRAHRETIFFGLSARQFLCAILAVGLAAGIYLGLGNVIGKEAASWLCLLLAAPVAVAGFFYRGEYNQIILDKAAESNNLVQEKYITLSIGLRKIEQTRAYFRRVDTNLSASFGRLDSGAYPISYTDRLRLLHDFFRPGEEAAFRFDLSATIRRGITDWSQPRREKKGNCVPSWDKINLTVRRISEVNIIPDIREKDSSTRDKSKRRATPSVVQRQMVQKFINELNHTAKQSEAADSAENAATGQLETAAREIVHEAIPFPRSTGQHPVRGGSTDFPTHGAPEQINQPHHVPNAPRTPTPTPQEQARRTYVQQAAKAAAALPIKAEPTRAHHSVPSIPMAENPPRQRSDELRTRPAKKQPRDVLPTPQARMRNAFVKTQKRCVQNPSIESTNPSEQAAPFLPQPPVADAPAVTPERQPVTAAGSGSTGTVRPFGLDCSGFVDWSFYNATNGAYLPGRGGGAATQHSYCTDISWSEAQPGDLVFYPGDTHVGIVGGRDTDGNLLIVHCSGGANGVVITGSAGFTSAARPDCFAD